MRRRLILTALTALAFDGVVSGWFTIKRELAEKCRVLLFTHVTLTGEDGYDIRLREYITDK